VGAPIGEESDATSTLSADAACQYMLQPNAGVGPIPGLFTLSYSAVSAVYNVTAEDHDYLSPIQTGSLTKGFHSTAFECWAGVMSTNLPHSLCRILH
jgi:hypothetical protein